MVGLSLGRKLALNGFIMFVVVIWAVMLFFLLLFVNLRENKDENYE